MNANQKNRNQHSHRHSLNHSHSRKQTNISTIKARRCHTEVLIYHQIKARRCHTEVLGYLTRAYKCQNKVLSHQIGVPRYQIVLFPNIRRKCCTDNSEIRCLDIYPTCCLVNPQTKARRCRTKVLRHCTKTTHSHKALSRHKKALRFQRVRIPDTKRESCTDNAGKRCKDIVQHWYLATPIGNLRGKDLNPFSCIDNGFNIANLQRCRAITEKHSNRQNRRRQNRQIQEDDNTKRK